MTKHFGYNVKVKILIMQFGMNITDVDDKIINNSRAEGI